MSKVLVAISMVVDVLVSPASGMRRVRAEGWTRCLLPGLLIVGSSILLTYCYFAWVDPVWFKDLLLRDLQPDQRAIVDRSFTPTLLFLTTAIPSAIFTLMGWLAVAAFLFIVGKVKGSDLGYGRWIALTVFASTPSLLVLPVGLLVMALSPGGHLTPDGLDPVTLTSILQLEPQDPWAAFGRSVGPIGLWNVALLTLGVREFLRSSLLQASAIVLVPAAVIYAVWGGALLATGGSA
jgi:hypothetical protein